MNKIIYKKRLEAFNEVLKQERVGHSISQKDLSSMLGIPQSFISKSENGERRLDVIELMEYCDAMGCTLTDFAFRLEGRLFSEDLMSQRRVTDFKRWLSIYKEYYHIE